MPVFLHMIDWYVQRAEVGGRTFYRVRVGTYASRLEAQRVAQRLAAVGYTVIVMEELSMNGPTLTPLTHRLDRLQRA